ncbi:MAG TPA: CCA tRNA nucleotidyltransferase [bacterium (Candidatus Stahlbacteria)]|nr:CCA tRNA nucleotidyltransferase [Candidatus Stahlbacteria bacterium]
MHTMKEVLKKIGKIAEQNGVKAYAVGGIVRDYFLGKENLDIDICLEENGKRFGEQLKRVFGGKLTIYPQFGTALLETQGLKIDIALTRKESYPEPAHLPVVEPGTLEQDLARRDFTINAMAFELKSDWPQHLIDPFEGKKDLQNGIIRVLHDRSFIDDPTRIFRAIRFAGRLGFQIEGHTKLLMKDSIRLGMIQKLTPERIRNEIILILEEDKRELMLNMLEEFGILNILGFRNPDSLLLKELENNIEFFREAVAQSAEPTKDKLQEWFIYLLAILDPEKGDASIPAPTQKDLQRLRQAKRMLKTIGLLKDAKKPSDIYRLLSGYSDEVLIFGLSSAKGINVKNKFKEFITKYRNVKVEITGANLSAMGIPEGPIYKEILSKALDAKLDGLLKTKEDEIRFAQQYAQHPTDK